MMVHDTGAVMSLNYVITDRGDTAHVIMFQKCKNKKKNWKVS